MVSHRFFRGGHDHQIGPLSPWSERSPPHLTVACTFVGSQRRKCGRTDQKLLETLLVACSHGGSRRFKAYSAQHFFSWSCTKISPKAQATTPPAQFFRRPCARSHGIARSSSCLGTKRAGFPPHRAELCCGRNPASEGFVIILLKTLIYFLVLGGLSRLLIALTLNDPKPLVKSHPGAAE
jgi:hypothetical protein